MAYLVLARKYRPQTFTEIVGQEHVTQTLANAFAQDRVHHAFLFCGPRGVGKTTAARVLAKALNCENGPTANPCGTCSACVTITNGTAVDYFEMDGASNRGIDSIRELTDAVRYQPAVLRKKVYVIDEVHMLTTEAFNALLKTLEEPPPHVTFVMATTEPHKVPNTILSRCQRFDFKLVPLSRLTLHLTDIFSREEIEIEPTAVGLLARESGGSVRDSLSLSDQVISYAGAEKISEAVVADVLGVADRSLTRKLVGALSAADAQTALVEVDTATARGVDEVQIARALVRHLRDVAVTQSAPTAEGLIEASADEIAELKVEAAALEPSRLRQMFDRMMRACDDLGESQQPRLVLDFALIDVAAQQPVLPLGDLIDRLADLETRILAGGGRPPRGSGGPIPTSSSGSGRASPARSAVPPVRPTAAMASALVAPVATVPRAGAGAGSSAPPTRTPTEPPPKSANEPSRTSANEPPRMSATASALPPIPPPDSPPPQRPQLPPPAVMPTAPDVPQPQVARATAPDVPQPQAARARAPDVPQPQATRAAEAGPASAPQPASAPAAQVVTPSVVPPGNRMLAAWEKIIVALEKSRQLGLAGLYQNAKVLSFSQERVEVGFPADSMTAEVAATPDKVAQMTAFLAEQHGREVGFSVRLLSGEEISAVPQAKSLLEASREAKQRDNKERRDEANAHPMTKIVLETFGATIKEIKTDV